MMKKRTQGRSKKLAGEERTRDCHLARRDGELVQNLR